MSLIPPDIIAPFEVEVRKPSNDKYAFSFIKTNDRVYLGTNYAGGFEPMRAAAYNCPTNSFEFAFTYNQSSTTAEDFFNRLVYLLATVWARRQGRDSESRAEWPLVADQALAENNELAGKGSAREFVMIAPGNVDTTTIAIFRNGVDYEPDDGEA